MQDESAKPNENGNEMKTEMTTKHQVPEIDVEQLPEDVESCHALIMELVEAVGRDKVLIEGLQHQLEQMLKHRYGSRSDKVDPDQLLLFYQELVENLPKEAEEEAEEEQPRAKEKKRKKGTGRKELPDDLPAERIVHDVPEGEKICGECDTEKVVIGEERSKELEFVPASLWVKEHIELTYACPKGCPGQVVKGKKPVQPIEKGLAGPGLLAHVVTSKYGDHLPLNRQEDIFERHGVKIARQTQWDWVAATSELVKPLVELMKEEVLQSEVVQTDDTPIKMQGQKVKSRLWVYVGDDNHPFIVFDHTRSRERDGPREFLKEFKGTLQADAYPGYDCLFEKEVEEAGCWAHARRKFVEAESNDPARSLTVVAWIKRLYKVEREAKDFLEKLPSDLDAKEKRRQFLEKRKDLREKKSRPLMEGTILEDGTEVEGLESWFRKQSVLPKSPIGNAIQYTLNNIEALKLFLDRPELEIDNNASERAIRPITVGRSNWGMLGSKRGGDAAANHYSLIHTCKRHEIDPFEYLRDVFTRIRTHPKDRLDDFLPNRWKALRQEAEPTAPTP